MAFLAVGLETSKFLPYLRYNNENFTVTSQDENSDCLHFKLWDKNDYSYFKLMPKVRNVKVNCCVSQDSWIIWRHCCDIMIVPSDKKQQKSFISWLCIVLAGRSNSRVYWMVLEAIKTFQREIRTEFLSFGKIGTM